MRSVCGAAGLGRGSRAVRAAGAVFAVVLSFAAAAGLRAQTPEGAVVEGPTLHLRVLHVVIPNTFMRRLSAADVAATSAHFSKVVGWFDAVLGARARMEVDYVQIDRLWTAQDMAVEWDGTTTCPGGERLAAELQARGIRESDYAHIVVHYGYEAGVQPWNTRPGPVPTVVGPGASLFSGPDRANGLVSCPAPLTESETAPIFAGLLGSFRQMFAAEGFYSQIDSPADLKTNLPELVRQKGGLRGLDAAAVAALVKRGNATDAALEWPARLDYYEWLLQKGPADAWPRLAPHFGTVAATRYKTDPPGPFTLRPVHRRYFVPRGDTILISAFATDSDGKSLSRPELTLEHEGAKPQRMAFRFLDGELPRVGLFSSPLTVDFDRPRTITLRGRDGAAEVTAAIDVIPLSLPCAWLEPSRVVRPDIGETVSGTVRVGAEALAGPAVLECGATVAAVLWPFQTKVPSGRDQPLTTGLAREVTPGEFQFSLRPERELTPDRYLVEVRSTLGGKPLPVQYMAVRVQYSWSLDVPPRVDGVAGTPQALKVRCVSQDRTPPLLDVHAKVTGMPLSVPLREGARSDEYSGLIPSVPEGVHAMEIFARERSAGRIVRTEIALVGKCEGQVEGEDPAHWVGGGGGRVEIQEPRSWNTRYGGTWFEEKQRTLYAEGQGAFMTFRLDAPRKAAYNLVAFCAGSYDYGQARATVDGKQWGPPFDFYRPQFQWLGRVPFGTGELEAGPHEVRFEIIGKNPAFLCTGYTLGIDALALEPLRESRWGLALQTLYEGQARKPIPVEATLVPLAGPVPRNIVLEGRLVGRLEPVEFRRVGETLTFLASIRLDETGLVELKVAARDPDSRVEQPPRSAWIAVKSAGIQFEAEEAVDTLKTEGGSVAVQTPTDWSDKYQGKWFGGKQVYLQAARPGGVVRFRFTVKDEGTRTLFVYAPRSDDFGILRFAVDGEVVGPAHDAWSARLEPPRRLDLGPVRLKPGEHVLELRVTDHRADSTGYGAGLDAFGFE